MDYLWTNEVPDKPLLKNRGIKNYLSMKNKRDAEGNNTTNPQRSKQMYIHLGFG